MRIYRNLKIKTFNYEILFQASDDSFSIELFFT